jgi:PAS domain S-box-containing protein
MFVDDLDAGPDMPESLRASFRAAGVRSYVTVPFMAAGRLMGTLSVQMAAPRVWTPEDVELIEAAVERTWEAMQRARAQLALRESEATLAFLLELGDRMRDRAAAADILRDAVEAIGRRLAANRVGYAEIDSAADVLTVDVEWGDGTLAPIAGRHPLAAFGRVHLESLGRGETARIDDVDHSAQVDASNRPAIDAMDIRAAITVPLVRRGELVALLSVHHGTPRAWTDGEVRLVEEVAERTWSTVERARAEAELRESQKLLAAFMENAPVGMYLKDESGRYVMANAGMDRIFGRPASEAIGRHADELFDETTRGKIVAQDRIALNDGRAQVAEQFLPGGAEESWTLVIRFPVDLGAQGKRIGGFAIDLSEQKRAEADLARSREALYQSEKLTALGSLLAGVSHELNNPLSIVVAQAVMMEEDTEGSPLSVRAAKIRNAAERCAKIVQTFLAMARQKSPQRQRVDMNAVVRGALELTAYGLRSNGVELDCRLADQLPTVEGDADQLHQVIANLIVNAQQALQEVLHPRQLRVTTRRGAAGTIEVELADNGPGVPAEYRRRLFEPFFTTKPQGAGTGLGLSFSLGVAEAHGGTLELVDTEDGAAFRLTLPAGLVQAAAPEAAAGPAPAPSRGDALVVDDEVDIAEIVAELLGKQGYRVQVARSGAEAKRQLSARDFDLVLSDLRMPDVDGPALHAWIASQKPHLLDRLGFVTGDTMGPNAVRFLETSGCPTLEKPFTPRSFRDFVGRIHPEEVA